MRSFMVRARSDAKPEATFADRALGDSRAFFSGRESRSKRGRPKTKRRCGMFQGQIDLDAVIPVEATAIPDVLFERGLYWASGRSGVVNLVRSEEHTSELQSQSNLVC